MVGRRQSRIQEVSLDQLQEGDLCDFAYKQQSGNYAWYQWVCTAVFLGQEGDKVFISFRPKAGTSEMSAARIMRVLRLVTREQRMGKKEELDEQLIKLPKRLPGGTSKP